MTDSNKFHIITMPKQYSDRDREAIEQGYKALRDLEEDYRKLAEPILKAIAQIDARYVANMVIMPKSPPKDKP